MQILDILNYVQNNENSAFFYTPNIFKNEKSYLFKKPIQILKASGKKEILETLNSVDYILKNKIMGFAKIPYESGYHFQPKVISKKNNNAEITFYFYEKKEVQILNSGEIHYDKVDKFLGLKNIKNFKINIEKDDYVKKINKIKKLISKGDTYQINFTTSASFELMRKPISIFLQGIFNQSAKYSAFINSENEFVISFSPELFFETDYKTIISKPMKGTMKRNGDPQNDEKSEKQILSDEKNLAENVMIVDLLRNDIGKISKVNSVKVDKLYELEKYETLYQLTSTISGKLNGNKLSEIIKNLFPSGSITGAPKIRSMQIISDLEKSPRNIYTGSIGIFSNKNAVFNIPIRTIVVNKKNNSGLLGLGSGIVWDSNPDNEYQEVLLKGKFIKQTKYFELLETILFENGKYFLLDYHIARLKKSAQNLIFNFDETIIFNELEKLKSVLNKDKSYKVRLTLNKWGLIKTEYQIVEKLKSNVKVILSKKRMCSENKFLYNKTTFRPWDAQLLKQKNNGYDEVIFINKNNELLEGTFTNIVVKLEEKLFTPPLDKKILNGCFREYLIQNKICVEKNIKLHELKNADEIYLVNSLRKKINVKEVYDQEHNLIIRK